MLPDCKSARTEVVSISEEFRSKGVFLPFFFAVSKKCANFASQSVRKAYFICSIHYSNLHLSREYRSKPIYNGACA